MPRQARIDAPCSLHHIIARGIERSRIFREQEDYEDFLQRFGSLLLQTETKCYAWALIPNHFHLLLKTGNVPIATLMRRLLTGYAAGFNRRHRRSGHLFQNRYKSILCQEDTYLLELVRYIHLNPLRAKLVIDMKELEAYPYVGHGVILGKRVSEWQNTDYVLSLFSSSLRQARDGYEKYVADGVKLGKQPGLTGGGLIRSAGGWTAVRQMQNAGHFQKSDERILGDGYFVETVLGEADERMTRRFQYQAKGISLDHLQQVVAKLVAIQPEEMVGASKARTVVRARILFSYFAVREMSVPGTEVAKQLKISLPTVSLSVQRGEQLVRKEGLNIGILLNANI